MATSEWPPATTATQQSLPAPGFYRGVWLALCHPSKTLRPRTSSFLGKLLPTPFWVGPSQHNHIPSPNPKEFLNNLEIQERLTSHLPIPSLCCGCCEELFKTSVRPFPTILA